MFCLDITIENNINEQNEIHEVYTVSNNIGKKDVPTKKKKRRKHKTQVSFKICFILVYVKI